MTFLDGGIMASRKLLSEARRAAARLRDARTHLDQIEEAAEQIDEAGGDASAAWEAADNANDEVNRMQDELDDANRALYADTGNSVVEDGSVVLGWPREVMATGGVNPEPRVLSEPTSDPAAAQEQAAEIYERMTGKSADQASEQQIRAALVDYKEMVLLGREDSEVSLDTNRAIFRGEAHGAERAQLHHALTDELGFTEEEADSRLRPGWTWTGSGSVTEVDLHEVYEKAKEDSKQRDPLSVPRSTDDVRQPNGPGTESAAGGAAGGVVAGIASAGSAATSVTGSSPSTSPSQPPEQRDPMSVPHSTDDVRQPDGPGTESAASGAAGGVTGIASAGSAATSVTGSSPSNQADQNVGHRPPGMTGPAVGAASGGATNDNTTAQVVGEATAGVTGVRGAGAEASETVAPSEPLADSIRIEWGSGQIEWGSGDSASATYDPNTGEWTHEDGTPLTADERNVVEEAEATLREAEAASDNTSNDGDDSDTGDTAGEESTTDDSTDDESGADGSADDDDGVETSYDSESYVPPDAEDTPSWAALRESQAEYLAWKAAGEAGSQINLRDGAGQETGGQTGVSRADLEQPPDEGGGSQAGPPPDPIPGNDGYTDPSPMDDTSIEPGLEDDLSDIDFGPNEGPISVPGVDSANQDAAAGDTAPEESGGSSHGEPYRAAVSNELFDAGSSGTSGIEVEIAEFSDPDPSPSLSDWDTSSQHIQDSPVVGSAHPELIAADDGHGFEANESALIPDLDEGVPPGILDDLIPDEPAGAHQFVVDFDTMIDVGIDTHETMETDLIVSIEIDDVDDDD